MKLTHFKRQLNALLPGVRSANIRRGIKKNVTDAFLNGCTYAAALGDVDMFHGKYLGPEGSHMRKASLVLLREALWADVQVERAALKADAAKPGDV